MSIAAPIPSNERQRLQALHGYAILDSSREQAFDDLTRIAAQLCGTPMALISLVDRTRQWFKAEVGLDVSETSRDVSFCAHAILCPGLFIVTDTREDIRFHDNPLVTGEPHLRFYAGSPLSTSDGHALGTLCVLDRVPRTLNDAQRAGLEALARQAMAQMEMRRVLIEAERIDKYRSRLMAVTGHDLKQPVNIIGMSLALLTDSVADAEAQEMLGYAKAANEKLGVELDMLAHASRLRQETVRIEPVPVQRLFNCISDNWGLRARNKGLELRVVPCAESVPSDERMLETIVGNLVGNAIKYTRTGGVLVGCRRRGKSFFIEVWDTGIGIPDDQLETIFESFHQLDGGRSEGLGLGLAIVRRTADLLGHDIRVSSRLGRGSRFSVRIQPLAATPVA